MRRIELVTSFFALGWIVAACVQREPSTAFMWAVLTFQVLDAFVARQCRRVAE